MLRDNIGVDDSMTTCMARSHQPSGREQGNQETRFKAQNFCQTQFQFAVQCQFSLKFDYYHPTTPGKVEMQLDIDHRWLWLAGRVVVGVLWLQGVASCGTG